MTPQANLEFWDMYTANEEFQSYQNLNNKLKDIEFAKENSLKKSQMRRFMSVFEKIVSFKSDGLNFRDMKQKIDQVLPDFETNMFNQDSSDPDEQIRLYEMVFDHWQHVRKENGNSLLR